ncbi:ferrochelatase [Sneathiella sp. P13V-1]|uniref:ferrochelatase n=1 Tax=Sneathiella sp. P13V-1 TaxID=2697366 RepID=UPI00187B123E|nr:ferrochelatase [Sneathiella sp. P13V-1]MBE7636074.1 ferrochelatase [Sneathiella sp. P13V-1]
MARKAVVLFNLGGPDNLEAVEPFLFNLFYDPAIIRLPKPLRFLVAKLISKRRGPIAREIYENMGGRSPIVPQTEDQASSLSALLNDGGDEYQVFIAMRYWHPRAVQTVKDVKAFNPDEVILLPLYPQFSTTTTASSLEEWEGEAKRQGLEVPTSSICCYPDEAGFVEANAELIKAKLAEVKGDQLPRLLFSAHGLPKKIVDAGDPYPWQVEQSVNAIMKALGRDDLEHLICFQSRVGPVEWIGPDTEEEIKRAGAEKRSVMVIPVAFVSEHSETLVELDIEYGELAKEVGIPEYLRVPTVTTNPFFVEGLARLVKGCQKNCMTSSCGKRICPANAAGCKTT